MPPMLQPSLADMLSGRKPMTLAERFTIVRAYDRTVEDHAVMQYKIDEASVIPGTVKTDEDIAALKAQLPPHMHELQTLEAARFAKNELQYYRKFIPTQPSKEVEQYRSMGAELLGVAKSILTDDLRLGQTVRNMETAANAALHLEEVNTLNEKLQTMRKSNSALRSMLLTSRVQARRQSTGSLMLIACLRQKQSQVDTHFNQLLDDLNESHQTYAQLKLDSSSKITTLERRVQRHWEQDDTHVLDMADLTSARDDLVKTVWHRDETIAHLQTTIASLKEENDDVQRCRDEHKVAMDNVLYLTRNGEEAKEELLRLHEDVRGLQLELASREETSLQEQERTRAALQEQEGIRAALQDTQKQRDNATNELSRLQGDVRGLQLELASREEASLQEQERTRAALQEQEGIRAALQDTQKQRDNATNELSRLQGDVRGLQLELASREEASLQEQERSRAALQEQEGTRAALQDTQKQRNDAAKRIEVLVAAKKQVQARLDKLIGLHAGKYLENATLAADKLQLQGENEALVADKLQLEGENEALVADKLQLEGENEALVADKLQLQGENEALVADKLQLEGENEALIADKLQLQGENEALIADKLQLEGENEALVADKLQLEGENEALIADKLQLQGENEALVADKLQLQGENEALVADNDELKHENQAVNHEKNLLALNRRHTKREKEALIADNLQLKGEKDLITANNQTLIADNDRLKNENNVLASHKNQLEGRVTDVSSRNAHLEKVNKNLVHGMDTIQGEKKGIALQEKRLHEENGLLVSRNEQYRVSLDQSMAVINDLRNRVKSQEEENDMTIAAYTRELEQGQMIAMNNARAADDWERCYSELLVVVTEYIETAQAQRSKAQQVIEGLAALCIQYETQLQA
ncbi:hypothetical protein J1614_011711 [Plenodomus biglobosus]|nr:hypothetical protein J1614_011711 [Plenodomus biglobosus]